ncbi:MAG: M28 family peptidase [Balneolaceae bacterium]|nr:M28 family peptidase [Balneolaceae bacterium]
MNADPEQLKQIVRKLANELGPRDAGHPENMARVADYIREQLSVHANRVEEQPYEVIGMTVRNVRAFFGPDTDQRIVVGAHYDVAGPYPGADDNASGVAGLLELARLLSGDDLTMMVELVSYPLEEPPFFYTNDMGSAVHANSLKEEGVDLRAMIALEMIGYFRDKPNSQRFPLFLLRPFYPSTGNFISVVGNLFQRSLVKTVREAMREATPLPVESINAPRILPGIALSDHLNYWKAGYEAVMITDTAMFRNPNYHTASDTPDTLDYRRMGQVVDGIRAAVLALME